MSISNRPRRRNVSLSTPISALAEAAFRWGWNDQADGIAFRPSYDVMSRGCQLNYESGRLAALRVKMAGLNIEKVPNVRSNAKKASSPQAIIRQVRLSNTFPDVFPRKKQDDDPNLQVGVVMTQQRARGRRVTVFA